MISLICVYNNENILEKQLLNSLENQSLEYQLILLNNTKHIFESAAKALNYGGEMASGDYLIFIHQDFIFSSEFWLEKSLKILQNLDNLGVAGLAGKKKIKSRSKLYSLFLNKNRIISNLKTGNPSHNIGVPIKEPQKVQTLDECILIVPNTIFDEFKFDEDVCDNWHLYAADYCLTAKKAGYDVYVIPLEGYHESPGYSFSEDQYYSTLKKLIKKHKKDYKWIFTSTGSWSTVYPLFFQILYQKFYYFLKLV